MAQDKFSHNCRNCNNELVITSMKCPNCELRIEGDMKLPRLARLTAQDREFIELFVLSGGSLKEVGKTLDISYPTVRNRLDVVISNLRSLDKELEQKRVDIITKLENKELDVETALKMLSRL